MSAVKYLCLSVTLALCAQLCSSVSENDLKCVSSSKGSVPHGKQMMISEIATVKFPKGLQNDIVPLVPTDPNCYYVVEVDINVCDDELPDVYLPDVTVAFVFRQGSKVAPGYVNGTAYCVFKLASESS